MWRIQGLDQVSCMAEEHCVAGGPHDHADHGEPNVTHAFWGVGTVSYAQHVTHGHKQGVWVLYVPRSILGKINSDTEQKLNLIDLIMHSTLWYFQ